MNHQNSGIGVEIFQDTNRTPRIDITVGENNVGNLRIDATVDDINTIRVGISSYVVESM